MNLFAATGHLTLDALRETGRISIFAGQGAIAWFNGPFYWRAFYAALIRIGFTSLPVVGLTAIFTGAALALNIYDGSLRFNAETFLPQILSVSIVRELGPVLAALMVAGRASSAMAAEIGTMRVTEQIDAMSTLAVSPFKYLIAPPHSCHDADTTVPCFDRGTLSVSMAAILSRFMPLILPVRFIFKISLNFW